MAVLVKNFEGIRRILREVSGTGRLCCFFAIDDRPSMSAALNHLWECRKWIDTMAAATGVYAFVPVEGHRKPTERFLGGERSFTIKEHEHQDSMPKIDYVLNPTVQISARFGVLPNELPGVLFFQASPEGLAGKACFVSVPEEHFRSNSFEQFLAILFF